MKTLLQMVLLFSASLAFAGADEDLKPEQILAELAKVEKLFSDTKPVDAEKIMPQFPRAMRLLGLSVESNLPVERRLPVTLRVAVLSQKFDESNTAADFLVDDYRKHKGAYERELAKNSNEELKNRFLKAIRAFARAADNPDKMK